MRRVERYQADDGTLWESAAKADARDQLLVEIADAVEPLGNPRPRDASGRCYIQHTAKAVIESKRRFLAIGHRLWPGESIFAMNPREVHNLSYVGRWFDDSDIKALYSAWYRIMCTDEKHREWEQPYYASHTPERAEKLR